MKVRIVKCPKPGWWYANKIGQTLDVVKVYYLIWPEEERPKYQLKGGIGIIQKTDCEVIEQ